MLTGNSEIPQDIALALKVMGRQVASDLEYHPYEVTGNHAFNNARALLFAGLVANLPSAVDLAFAISKERLPKLVTPDGFLREGSSHYHFLFTRWVLEMLWLSDLKGNQEFVQLLKPYAELLVKRCWFFLVKSNPDGGWQIPLIGDVSPDFPPFWLLSLPWSFLACDVFRPSHLPMPPQQRGWSDLFGVVEGSGNSWYSQTEIFPISGWFRIEHQPWTVFVRAESNDGRMQANHRHNDLGSFVLFRNGSLLIADGGRFDYTGSPLSQYGKSALAHNSLLIDGLAVNADDASWFSNRYVAVSTDVDVKIEAEDTLITLKHNGFSRFATVPIHHQRRVRLSEDGIRIEDQLDGHGAHRVQMRFHFAPGIELNGDLHQGWKLGDTSICRKIRRRGVGGESN